MSTRIKLPSLLSFERKLEPSDALMYDGKWQEDPSEFHDWKTIPITKRQNRSTQSAYGINDAKKSEPNPVSSDSDDANLSHNKDTLKLGFTLRIIGDIGIPFACNDPVFESRIIGKVNEFKNNESFNTLAFRYAYNIVSGRFLWRNRVGAESIEINVDFNGLDEPLRFNAYEFSLNNFSKGKDNESLQKLTEKIQAGLEDHEQFILIEIDAYVKLGKGQHIFPSQEMNMGEKGKSLFRLDNCAAMHNVKIGNALRTIDNWYENAEFPINIEPYGSVTQRGQAYRKSKNDLYSLIGKWVNEEAITSADKNYIVANLIRGGVFSGEKKKAK